MYSIVVINPHKKNSFEFEELGTIKFGKESILFGQVELSNPSFDNKSKDNRQYVLLKVSAFSCNYRDKAIIAETYRKIKDSERLFFPFGSEFCATVIDVGEEVEEFEIGDIVMADCAYPSSGSQDVMPGVTTNFASLGWLRIHKNKIIKAPNNLTEQETACFSLGSQTASSMIRRSGIVTNGGQPLIFSARSATSLFIIRQLISQGFEPICLSTTEWSEEEQLEVYPAKVELMSEYFENKHYENYITTHVFDPYFDMNIGIATYCLSMGGTYVTCGLRDQHPDLSHATPRDSEAAIRGAVEMSILKNLTIIGNCLGTKEDLLYAIELQYDKNINPIIDNIYTFGNEIDFIKHSFFERTKFGKCVFSYSKLYEKGES